jgi:hypothetical protein
MAYRRVFFDFRANGGLPDTSNSFDNNIIEGIPQHEFTFQTPRAILGPNENYRTPEGIISTSPSKVIGGSASLELYQST